MRNNSYEDKVALVTGASRGIGRATALALANAGTRVIIHYGRIGVLASLNRPVPLFLLIGLHSVDRPK